MFRPLALLRGPIALVMKVAAAAALTGNQWRVTNFEVR
jgi:hypothetical protein